jgi:hypothetical protein
VPLSAVGVFLAGNTPDVSGCLYFDKKILICLSGDEKISITHYIPSLLIPFRALLSAEFA